MVRGTSTRGQMSTRVLELRPPRDAEKEFRGQIIRSWCLKMMLSLLRVLGHRSPHGVGNEHRRVNAWSIVCLEYRSPHGVGNEHRRANVWSIARLTVRCWE
ncbi:hypothetical protein ACN38_g6603 [Penicillium nordicum]|uniref:Uncharacterized protein n=1 Tax=Penicillium nordicum TaxID=229535 RepID=A0A0M9WF46_9EURO|nr:hypothetical protein ACN38_g6603 [Penicillium nordicum]